MPGYKIFETNQFRKEMKKLFSTYEERIISKKLSQKIYPQLRAQLYYGIHIKKLKDYEPESWRYRIGNFRLFFSIDEEKKVVILTSIRGRKEAYRG